MRTNIDIDDDLMAETMQAAGVKTKKDAVETAMRRFVQLHRQRRLRDLRGTVEWEGDLEQSRQGRVHDL